jgi:ATP-dependent Clp protease adaptor protein ClpS
VCPGQCSTSSSTSPKLTLSPACSQRSAHQGDEHQPETGPTTLGYNHGGNGGNQQQFNNARLGESNVTTKNRAWSTARGVAGSLGKARGHDGANIEGHGYPSYGWWAITTNRQQNVSVLFATPHANQNVEVAEPSVDQSTDEVVDLQLPWIVLVWNDPINLMSYVSFVFQKVFGFTKEKADNLMMDVHEKGRAVVSSGPREKAELDVFRLHEHGLWATMQQDT